MVERLEASNRELARQNRGQDERPRGAVSQEAAEEPVRRSEPSETEVERLYLRSLARTESQLLTENAERRQELPNLLLLAADETLPDGCRSFAPAADADELSPSICRLGYDKVAGRLSIESVEAGPAMAEEIAALFAS